MERWWNGLSDTYRALWLAAVEHGSIPESLITTLPPERQSANGDWVYWVVVTTAGVGGQTWEYRDRFRAFLDGKLDESRRR